MQLLPFNRNKRFYINSSDHIKIDHAACIIAVSLYNGIISLLVENTKLRAALQKLMVGGHLWVVSLRRMEFALHLL